MKRMKKINHFSHQHPLRLYEIDDYSSPRWDKCACHLCGVTTKFTIYGCKECRFFIHDSCAELPQQLNHPFHPQHALSLYDVAANASEMFQCHACGEFFSNFIYHCAKCKFNLDFHCQDLKPINKYEDETSQNSHPHPLFICSKPVKFVYRCSLCESLIHDQKMFVCIQCKNLLHEDCALPLEIRHPFHSEHPLALIPKGVAGKKYKCHACSSTHIGKIYYCSQCEFSLDIRCASLFPTSRSTESVQELQKHPLNHSHPLIQCDKTKKILFDCSGCDSRIEGSVFVCLKCGYLLDKTCIELLPEISHPFHPPHPLTLFENFEGHRNRCRGCKWPTAFFSYVCWKCDFHLDPHCALVKPHMIQSKIHQHPLAFLKTQLCRYLSCTACGKSCEKQVFQCADCDFGLHLKCFSLLPQLIKHDCHFDPLTLTHSRIEEVPDADSDEEFYCYACEEIRDPDDPTYYCKECPFVAHVDCVISEILHCIERDSSGADDRVGNAELGRSVSNVSVPEDNEQTSSPDVPMENTNSVAQQEEMVKKNIPAQDENIIKRRVAAVDEEIAALQTKIEELKDLRKQLLSSTVVS